ncbi:MAG: methyltransferase domain-containing protein [Verrucomicrobiales bacterium]|nr:methyltransferase domain-containing protein [Verrucomicrobiales bacterium]
MENLAKTEPAAEFDAFADNYDSELQKGLVLSGEGKDYFAAGRMRWLSSQLAALGEHPRRALDFGCGTGSATPFFFDHLGIETLVGMDPSEKSLEVARDTWTAYPVAFSAHLDAADQPPFDLAFCNGVFHHIPREFRAGALSDIFRNLRPGGLFAFWENNPWNPVTRYAMHRVPFDRDAILIWPHEARRLLRAAGFTILRTDYVFFFPRFAAALRGLEPSLRWLPLGGQYLVLAGKPSALPDHS